MDLNLLTVFQTVAESASFSSAAARLGVKRSSVSRSIAALEHAVGVQLLSRTTRSLALTTAGAALYAKLKPQLDGLKDALGTLPEQEEQASGLLRVTAAIDVGAMVLAPVAPGFLLRYPGIQLDVRLTNARLDLVAEGVDAALRVTATKLSDSTLVARKLAQLESGLYGAPEYFARVGTPRVPDDLDQHDWVAFRDFRPPPPCDKVKLRPRLVADDLFFLSAALRAGAGVGMLPSFVAAPDLAAGRLVRVLPRVTLGVGALYLVHPPAQHVPRKVLAFGDYMREHLSRTPLATK
jgi:DNA-binding transcriptional LysR family regulator